MATILSDADVFGSLKPAPDSNVLSDAEVFGDGSPMPKPRAPRSDASIALGGVGAATKAVARNVADFGDMFLSIPGMAMGTAADVASRVQSLFERNDHRAAGRIAKEVRQGITHKFSPTILRDLTELAISAVSKNKDKLAESDVQAGMSLITQGIEKGGSWVEKKTNGLITAETFDSLVTEGMALGGVKGANAGARKFAPRDPSLPAEIPRGPFSDRTNNFLMGDVELPWRKKTPVEPPPRNIPDVEVKPPVMPLQQWVNRQAGVPPEVAPKRAKKDLEARRRQAKEAFERDPLYADQQAGIAETEARMREGAPPSMSAPGGLSQTGPRAPRTGLREAVEPPELPPARVAPIEGVEPAALDSALAKIRSNRAFEMTAEEKIAMRDAGSAWNRPEMTIEGGRQPKLPPRGERGSSTQDANRLVAALGLGTGLAAWMYYHGNDDLTLGMAAAGGMIGARSALGPAMRDSGYTLKTLERLPQNRTEFTTQQVKEQLARADVSKAEKDLVSEIIEGKETITANELVAKFAERTKALELKPKEVKDYADYGIENIGRLDDAPSRVEWTDAELQEFGNPNVVTPRTTLYNSPNTISSNNHFGDPNYFAHTRSFDEGGIRHVVEIQSDVAQHQKSLQARNPADVEALAKLDEQRGQLRDELKRLRELPGDQRDQIGVVADQLTALNREAAPIEQRVNASRESLQESYDLLNKMAKISEDVQQAFLSVRSTIPDYLKALDEYEKTFDKDVLPDAKMRLGQDVFESLQRQGATSDMMETAARRGDYEIVYENAKADLKTAEKQTTLKPGQWPPPEYDMTYVQQLAVAFEKAFYKETRSLDLRASEAEAKLGPQVPPVMEPMLKDWYKRIVREELANVLRSVEDAKVRLPRVEARIEHLRDMEVNGGYGKEGMTLEEVRHNLGRAKDEAEKLRSLAASEGQPVRFATADTVAKVEGWPESFERMSLERDRMVLQDQIRSRAEAMARPGEDSAFRREFQRQDEVNLAKVEEQLAKATKFSPQHQSIYDRYKKEIEKFLKNEYKAQPYTDPQGHTWLEVPAQPRGPVKMYGRASLRDMATLAAVSGGALLADFLQGDDRSLTADAVAGLLAGAAVRARPSTVANVAAGSAVAAFLSSEENRTRNSALTGAVLGLASFARSKNRVVAKWAADSAEATQIAVGNLSSELRRMSPPLLRRFTEHERQLKIREHDAMVRIAPLAEGLLHLPDPIREAVDIALFTGSRSGAAKIIDALKDAKLSKALRTTFDYIDETGAKLDSLGLVRRLNKEHFPRIVTDLDGLMAALGKEGGDFLGRKLAEAATESLRKAGTPLSDIEMSRIVNEHLQAAVMRSDVGGQSSILKKRTIQEVTKELLPYYATAGDSIAIYARAASREIERARFFGKDLVKAPDTKAVNVAASVGHLVARERAAGRLTSEELGRLESMTKARFGPGERSSHWLTQSYKNIVYSMLLGNPLSALVQFGDAAVAVAVHGLIPTIKAVAEMGKKGPAKWTLSDFGLVNHLSEDLVIGSRNPLRIGRYEITTAKFLDKTLKYSGFSFVDEFAKMVHLNAAAAKFERLAKTTKGVTEIQRLYGEYFGADTPQLLLDLRAGKKSPLVGELIFRELSDTQPITKLEMPEGYLSSPNGRVLYTLKSFMVKQMNLARDRGFSEIAKGDPASVRRGTSFLLRYSLALGLAGASISVIQDWLLGREPSFEMADISENVFKAFGWGSYAVAQARKGNALQAAANLVVPPYKLFEEIWATPEQLEKFANDDPKANPKGAMYIPIVGKLIYNRFLGGAERANRRKERERQQREREGVQ